MQTSVECCQPAAASGRECGEMEVGDLAVAVQARGCCIAKAGSQRHVFRPEQFEVRGVTVAGVKQRHAVPDWSAVRRLHGLEYQFRGYLAQSGTALLRKLPYPGHGFRGYVQLVVLMAWMISMADDRCQASSIAHQLLATPAPARPLQVRRVAYGGLDRLPGDQRIALDDVLHLLSGGMILHNSRSPVTTATLPDRSNGLLMGPTVRRTGGPIKGANEPPNRLASP